MEISFKNFELRDYFLIPAKALACFGPVVARVLAVRFADLRAAENIAQLALFSATEIHSDGRRSLQLPIAEGYSVILEILDEQPKAGSTKRSKVVRLKVIAIERSNE